MNYISHVEKIKRRMIAWRHRKGLATVCARQHKESPMPVPSRGKVMYRQPKYTYFCLGAHVRRLAGSHGRLPFILQRCRLSGCCSCSSSSRGRHPTRRASKILGACLHASKAEVNPPP